VHRASGRPHAPWPARTSPPRSQPPRVEPPRYLVSSSCADAWPKSLLFLLVTSFGPGWTLSWCGLGHRRRASPPASCGAAIPLEQNVEHLAVTSKTHRVFLVHAGRPAVLGVADPPDPVRPASHILSRTLAHTEPSCRRSRRDLVWLTTPAAMWAAAGLKAAHVDATFTLAASLQPPNHQL
jgi:hypothetical protein